MTDERDHPTPRPRDRMPPSIEEQQERLHRDTDPAPEDPIITALRNMMKAHEEVEAGAMAALREGIRDDFKEEVTRIANSFLADAAERKRELAEVRTELEKLRGRVAQLEERVELLTGDSK